MIASLAHNRYLGFLMLGTVPPVLPEVGARDEVGFVVYELAAGVVFCCAATLCAIPSAASTTSAVTRRVESTEIRRTGFSRSIIRCKAPPGCTASKIRRNPRRCSTVLLVIPGLQPQY